VGDLYLNVCWKVLYHRQCNWYFAFILISIGLNKVIENHRLLRISEACPFASEVTKYPLVAC
jgi:hypothetical protein